jgi:hypothetical protein
MNSILVVNGFGAYTLTGLSPTTNYIGKLTARNNADNATVKMKEVVANGVSVVIVIPS